MKDSYQLIVFDWDGTLMDSEARIVECMRRSLADIGAEPLPANSLKQVIGLGLREAMQGLVPGETDGFYNSMADAYRVHWLGSDVPGSAMFEGIEALLHDLHGAGYLLGVATGKSRRGLQRQFEETGLGGLFHSSRCADECASKPAPDMMNAILEELSVSQHQTLVIGDTAFDLGMAQAAGCDRVAVTYGVHEPQRLAAYDPICMLESPAALINWFQTHFLDKSVAAVS